MGRDIARKRKTCKDRYDWYKEHGICPSCGRKWSEPGRVYCKDCAAKIDAYKKAQRTERIEKKRQRRSERIAAGLCTECGARPATPGMRMCPRCRAMRNDSTRKYKIIKRIEKAADAARRAGEQK